MTNEQIAHDLTMYVINHATNIKINNVEVEDCNGLYPNDFVAYYKQTYDDFLNALNNQN